MNREPLGASVAQCLARSSELDGISDSPRLDAELLLVEATGQTRTWLYTWPEKRLTRSQQRAFDTALARRRTGEPVAHILGRREFWSLPLRVDASTLIPRPDTELLVETTLTSLPGEAPQSVLDLGTGTGAVALALASERPSWQMLGLDISPAATDLAERNRRDLEFENVDFLTSDWFSAVPAGRQFNAIVSNPPYIAPNDPHLAEGDLRYEPLSALVAAERGLAAIAYIVQSAPPWLEAGGCLLLEHGWDQGQAVRELLHEAAYENVQTHRDLAGHERVTSASQPARGKA